MEERYTHVECVKYTEMTKSRAGREQHFRNTIEAGKEIPTETKLQVYTNIDIS